MTDSNASDAVHLDVHGAVATLTLDSPANRNALSMRLRDGLAAGLEQALALEQVRLVVLTHAGPAFCSGADLREARDGSASRGASLPSILNTLWSSPKPIIARVDGAARAGGLGVLAACDVRLASETVSFAVTEVHLGLVPAVISSTVLRRMLPHAAAELFLTGETFSAQRAAQTGLLTAAVPAERLDDEVDRYKSMLLRGGPSALAGTKQMLRATRPDDLLADLEEQAVVSARYFASDEAREGLLAREEKRGPAWTSVTRGGLGQSL